MNGQAYSPIVRRAAREYFREDDAPLTWLAISSRRKAIDAIHNAFEHIPEECDQDLIEAIYKDPGLDFAETVGRVAYERGIKTAHAWGIVRRFAADVSQALDA